VMGLGVASSGAREIQLGDEKGRRGGALATALPAHTRVAPANYSKRISAARPKRVRPFFTLLLIAAAAGALWLALGRPSVPPRIVNLLPPQAPKAVPRTAP